MMSVDTDTNFLTHLFTLLQDSNMFQFTTEPSSDCQLKTFFFKK